MYCLKGRMPTSPLDSLARILGALAADSLVEGVGLGGSLARGDADEVSDIDLWIEGAEWSPERIGGLLLAARLRTMGGNPFLHGVTTGGTILDLVYGPPIPEGYVGLNLPASDPAPVALIPASGLVEEFWMMSLKHRKSVWRRRHALLTYGLHHDRRFLLRAWTLLATGCDPGDADTLFALGPLYERHVDADRLALLGLPLRSPEEIVYAIEAYRDEMSRLFPETTPLERLVRSMPLECAPQT